MRAILHLSTVLLCFSPPALAADEPPAKWVEPADGRRVVRLSREGGTAFAAEEKLLVSTRPTDSGLFLDPTCMGLCTCMPSK